MYYSFRYTSQAHDTGRAVRGSFIKWAKSEEEARKLGDEHLKFLKSKMSLVQLQDMVEL